MMEKVSLYVKKILALGLSVIFFYFMASVPGINSTFEMILVFAASSLLFAFLDFRITADKPRYLFGLNQSDAYLNKKGGFWNLFKWIVNLFGLLYDLIVWAAWGVYLVFVLFADLLLLIKTIIFWIIYAAIWLVRQLFPPFIFLFKMILHYLVYWPWWIYQLTVRNVKTSINRNFYFIALWGTIPAIFIVFLFYAISQLVGLPQLVLVSYVFAVIPLVWSFGEIAALRFEGREKDDYTAVKGRFRNGFDAVRSVLFYLVIMLVLIVAEIVLNMLGWIPNLSMSLLGITLNINMAISIVLIFLAIILLYVPGILPTYILYRPEHENDLKGSVSVLGMLGRKFLRYTFVELPASFFGGLLLVIPIVVMVLAYTLTDSIKDQVLETRIEHLSEKSAGMDAVDAYRTEIRIDRMDKYLDMPLLAPAMFRNTWDRNNVPATKQKIQEAEESLATREASHEQTIDSLSRERTAAGTVSGSDTVNERARSLSARIMDLNEEHEDWVDNQKDCIAVMKADLKEMKGVRAQIPIFYLFIGIFIALFGGLVLAVYIAYIGNVYYELYDLREDDKPSRWNQVITEIREQNPNQPLLGFTIIAIIAIVLILASSFGWWLF